MALQKSCNVKYLATHMLLIVLNNYLTLTNITVLSQVMYPCHKSCTHVTCHVPMSHVMYPYNMSCIYVTCHVFMTHSSSQVISFYMSWQPHFKPFSKIEFSHMLYDVTCDMSCHITCPVTCHMSCVMSHVMLCQMSCH